MAQDPFAPTPTKNTGDVTGDFFRDVEIANDKKISDLAGPAPARMPQQQDLSDLIAKWTHAFDLNNLVTAGSRKSDFMSGPLGDTSKPMTSAPMATAGTKTTLGG